MENILWNTWQYLVDVFDCFLILYLFRKMMRTRLRQPKYYYLFLPVLAAVLFAYVVNKLIVFRNFNLRPRYLAKEISAFVAARAFSGVLTWVMMVGMVRLDGDRGFLYEMFCKAVVSAVNLVLNYIFSKLWIFKKTTGEER